MADSKEARDIVVEWIDHILDRKKWTGTDLARHSELAPSTVLRMLNDPNHRFTPSLKTLQKISKGSGYPIPFKVTEALGASVIDVNEAAREELGATEPKGRMQEANRASNGAMLRRGQIAVRYVSTLPVSMHPVLKDEVSMPRPPSLDGDFSAFAFHMPGADLEPWFKAGTLMYATQRRDPYAGDMVLITDKIGKSRVRLLTDINENGLTLCKSTAGSKTEMMKFDDVGEIAVVAHIERI